MKNFDQLPERSRVWVYQSSQLLNNEEVDAILALGEQFIDNWTSHGKQMDAGVTVLHNCFIVVAVDENTAPASGCGIDKSVAFIKDIEEKLSVKFLERKNVAYRSLEGDIKLCDFTEFEQLFSAGLVNDQTHVFNNLVSTKAELSKSWEVPVANSWHSRMFKAVHS